MYVPIDLVSYTRPLWLMLISIRYGPTHEAYYTFERLEEVLAAIK
jgi:hypothetical protein